MLRIYYRIDEGTLGPIIMKHMESEHVNSVRIDGSIYYYELLVATACIILH